MDGDADSGVHSGGAVCGRRKSPEVAAWTLGAIRVQLERALHVRPGAEPLIDPDDNVVAGGPRAQDFSFEMGKLGLQKSKFNTGTSGRWLVEVAPDATYFSGGGLYEGGLDVTQYTLTCSSGNGHNQLDIVSGTA